ncbi:hypothetical protein N8344_00560 [bacterium]|nr:hypothetical protein [bacterium]
MTKRNNDRFKSTTGLNDLLFNLLVGFVFLFVVAFLLINPPTKKEEAPKKAEYLIIIEWDEGINDDVDLWVRDPNGITVSFTHKTGGLLNLEKDDLGLSNDRWRKPDGTIVTIPINREVITMRGIVPGRYQVAAHIYSRKIKLYTKPDGTQSGARDNTPATIIATLVRINPYGEVYTTIRKYDTKGQVFPLFNFVLDEEGNVISLDEDKNSIVMNRNGAGE